MFQALILSSFLLVSGMCGAEGMCETLHSALTVGDLNYLMTDQRVVVMSFGEEVDQDLDIPVRISGQTAATGLPGGQYVLISCAGSKVFSENGTLESDADFLLPEDVHVVDAALTLGDEVFLFSGSDYRTFNVSTSGPASAPEAMATLDLPGHVDAAFHDPFWSAMMVVRGNELYIADDSDETHTFYGPLPFDVFYDVKSLNLCPRDG